MHSLSKIVVDNMTYDDFDVIKDRLISEFDEFWTPGVLFSELENENTKSFVEGTSCKVELASTRVAMPKSEKNLELLSKINKIFEENGVRTITCEALSKN